MPIYPIRVPRESYRGSNPSRRAKVAEYNRDAATLEHFVNEQVRTNPSPIQILTYASIAEEIGMTLERVERILFSVAAGHTGLTVAKSEDAWREHWGQQ